MGVFVAAWPSVILIAALPEIADDLGSSESAMSWVVTLPLLVGSVLLPTFGKLGDLRGHRKVFLIGLGACGVSALLTACAWDVGSLIVLRTISQVAGVATLPTAIALMMDAFDLDERPKALAKWAFVTAASPALGLLFGGPLVGAVGWRGVFVIQGVIALACWPFARAWLKETPLAENVIVRRRRRHRPHGHQRLGAALLRPGCLARLDQPARAHRRPRRARSPAFVFWRIEARTDSPLMPAGLHGAPGVRRARHRRAAVPDRQHRRLLQRAPLPPPGLRRRASPRRRC